MKKQQQTGNMPWDDIWDFKHYRVSRVRLIKTRVRKIEKENNRLHNNMYWLYIYLYCLDNCTWHT